MRILVNTTSVAPGGGANVARSLLQELSALEPRDEYVVLVKDDLLEASVPWPPNVRFRRLGWFASSGPRRVLWEQVALGRLVHAERCDLLFSVGGFGPLWTRYPQTIVVQNALLYEILPGTKRRSRIRRRAQRWLQVACIRSGASVVCVSDYMRDLVVANIADTERNIMVIPHGTDMSLPPDAPSRELSRIDPPTLLWVGVNSPHKNLDDLLRAVPIVERLIGRSVALRIAGTFTSAEQATVVERALTLGASREPVFIGYAAREELRAEYLAATAFVSTSLLESSDMSVLEAMAIGTPVVGTDIPVRGEAKSSMRLYHPGSADDLASILAHVLLDDHEQIRLAAQGIAHARDSSWRSAAIRYRSVFVDAIENTK